MNFEVKYGVLGYGLTFGRSGRASCNQYGRIFSIGAKADEYSTFPEGLMGRISKAAARVKLKRQIHNQRTRFHSHSEEKRLFLVEVAELLNSEGAP